MLNNYKYQYLMQYTDRGNMKTGKHPVEVKCPKCGAEPNKKCTVSETNKQVLNFYHNDRKLLGNDSVNTK
jgi:hypothetical protein